MGRKPVRKDGPTADGPLNRAGRRDRASLFRKAGVPRSPASQVCSGAIATAGPSCGSGDVFEKKMRRQGQSVRPKLKRSFPCN
jgi:hypothetical protein